MKTNTKRIAATIAIAGAMFLGAQGVASADSHPSNATEVDGLGVLNGVVVNVPITVDDTNLGLNVLGLLDIVDGV